MADESPPEGPIQGNAHTSGHTIGHENAEPEDDPDYITFPELVKQQKAGEIDFERDFGFIKDEDDFFSRVWEHDQMNDRPHTASDFPLDSKIQKSWALKVAKAIVDMRRATDTTNKDRSKTSKSTPSVDAQDQNDSDEGDTSNDDEEPRKASIAVNFLNSLTMAEIELVSWRVVIVSGVVHEGMVSRGTFGAQKFKFKRYSSWEQRILAIVDSLEISKNVARALFKGGDQHIRDFVGSPQVMTKGVTTNKMLNDGRAKEKDEAKKAKELALEEEGRQLRSSIPTQAVLPAPANSRDGSAPEAIGSDDAQNVRQRPSDALPSIPTGAEKQKQTFTVHGGPAAAQRKPLPSGRGSNGVKKSVRSPADRLAMPPRPGASSSKASVPNKHIAGTNYKTARSSHVRPDGRHPLPDFRGHKPGHDPLRDNEFLPESSKKKPSHPAPAAGSSSKAGQASREISRTTVEPLPRGQSYPAGVPPQDFLDLSFLGGGPREGGILASLSSAKKRPRASSQTQEDGPGPSTGGTSGAATARKKQKQDSAGKSTSHEPYDFEQDDEEDDEDEDEEWFSADSS